MGLRILMVEDNEMNSRLAVVLLNVHGHVVTVSSSARELRERLATDQAPDIILMDILLDDGDGIELLHEVRATPGYATVPIVALTAHSLPDDAERLIKIGFNAVIAKPINTRMFAADVARYAAV